MKTYYNKDDIVIYNADCRDVLAELSADLVLTDPPYNVGKDYGGHNDNMPEQEYFEFMEQVITMSFAAAKNQAWVAPRYKLDFFLPRFPGHHLVVIRRGAGGPFRGGWSDQFETLIAVGKPSKVYNDLWDDIRLMGEGYFFREHTYGHPGYTPYPIMARAAYLLAEKSIIDPFCGTGTALKAAKDLGLKAVGIELNERYCEIAANRLSQEVLNLRCGAHEN